MNTCIVCGTQMKPLVSSWYCPNDCDRKLITKKIGTSWTEMAWSMIETKIPKPVASVLSRCFNDLDDADEWFVWRGTTLGPNCWMVGSKMEMKQRMDAELIIRVGSPFNAGPNGSIEIVKSRKGYNRLSDIPDDPSHQ